MYRVISDMVMVVDNFNTAMMIWLSRVKANKNCHVVSEETGECFLIYNSDSGYTYVGSNIAPID